MDLIVDLDWTENALKCWIGLRNGLGDRLDWTESEYLDWISDCSKLCAQ